MKSACALVAATLVAGCATPPPPVPAATRLSVTAVPSTVTIVDRRPAGERVDRSGIAGPLRYQWLGDETTAPAFPALMASRLSAADPTLRPGDIVLHRLEVGFWRLRQGTDSDSRAWVAAGSVFGMAGSLAMLGLAKMIQESSANEGAPHVGAAFDVSIRDHRIEVEQTAVLDSPAAADRALELALEEGLAELSRRAAAAPRKTAP